MICPVCRQAPEKHRIGEFGIVWCPDEPKRGFDWMNVYTLAWGAPLIALSVFMLVLAVVSVAKGSTGNAEPQWAEHCLRSRTVLRAEKVAGASDLERVKMVPVDYCDLAREACVLEGNEVAPSMCKDKRDK